MPSGLAHGRKTNVAKKGRADVYFVMKHTPKEWVSAP